MLERKDFYQTGLIPVGLPAGTGEVFHLVANKTTDTYFQLLWRRRIPDAKIFTDLQTAHDAMTASQNDTLLVWPGTYDNATKVTWSKSSTHMIGVGSPNQRIPATAGTTGNVYFTNSTAGTAVLLITGHHCRFENFSTYGNLSTIVSDITVQGRNTYLKNIFAKGGQDDTQNKSAVLGYSLYLDNSAAGYANGFTAIGCHFGDPRNALAGVPRVAGGQIYMTGVTNAGMCYEFKDCFVAGWSETAACSAVFVVGNWACDRYILWENCKFYNFYTNLGAALTQVITDTCGTTHMHMLVGSAQYGWGKWANSGTRVFGDMAVPYTTGGTMVTMT
jgi:hypothetical protein